jgi:prolyl oligopeptidase PreP (S9A serine peptidase family)
MNVKLSAISLLCASAIVASMGLAVAQDEPLAKSADKVVSLAEPIHVQATIVGIDAANRTLTVRGPHGDATVLVNQEVTNFDKLHVGDRVDVRYKNALLVSASKVKGTGERERIDTATYQPTSGAHGVTGFDATRQVEVIATVENVNNKKRTITLRGPWRTETLDLTPDFAAEKLKKGDTIHAVFVSATAVQVTPVSSTN